MATDSTMRPDLHGGAPSIYSDPGYGVDDALDAFAQPEAPPPPVDAAALQEHHVTAVMVAHNGQRWLDRALAALAASERPADRLVAVDTGSRDDSPALLGNALGGPAVVSVGKRTGFGDAVKAGLKHADAHSPVAPHWRVQTEWVWLLHDDCAPAPDALTRLLECAVRHPDAAVIGPKVRSWNGDRQLLEVGLTMSSGGRRQTNLEKREYDQGQHDVVRDVLAVGSAGMLVRRDVWEQLRGFDGNLSIFRDDIDFGWRANLAGHRVLVCPEAIVEHAEAAAQGRRRLGATRDRAHMVDRRNALYVLLANAPARRLLLVLLRVILGGVARSVGFLLGKQPALAFEELGAVLAVAGRPDRLIRARLARRRFRKVDAAELRELFPPRGQQLRTIGETVLALISGTGAAHDLPTQGRRALTEPESEDDEPDTDDSRLLTLLLHPPVLLIAGLAMLTALASRGLIGRGRLSGGGLFPAPSAAPELWTTYTESWHGVGLGGGAAAPPYLAAVAGLGSLVRSPSLAVDILMLGSVPLAALTAYLLLRKVVSSVWLRVWGAAVYGLLPAVTGAIAAGRLGTVTATVLTPLLVLAVMRTMGRPGRLGLFRGAWLAGLLLAIVTAFAPVAWLAAVLLAVLAVSTWFRSRRALLRLLVIVGMPPVVLAPWTFEVLQSPSLLLTEVGLAGPGLSEDALEPWSMLLMHPGGPGTGPVWLGAGLLLAGWAALFARYARGRIVAAWAVALVGLALGLLVSRVGVTGPTLETPVSGWPGYPVVLVSGGLMVAVVAGASGLRRRLAGASFGWRQPVAVVLVAAAGLTPLVAAGWWAWRGADDPLDRRSPAVLPAHVVEEGERPDRIRTLVLTRTVDGRVTYALLGKAGPRLGDADVGPPAEAYAALDEVVRDLVSGRGGADATALADFAARYVYVPAPADPTLTEVLDTVPGLTRASAPEDAVMWQVEGEIARVRVVGGADGPTRVAGDDVTAATAIPPGEPDRQLVLAERADQGWRATLAGEELVPATYNGWAQAFELPENGGELVLVHENSERSRWLTIQLVAVLVAVVLALPGMSRKRGAVEGVADIDADDVGQRRPAVAAAAPGAAGDEVTVAVARPGPETSVAPLPVRSRSGGRAVGRPAATRRSRHAAGSGRPAPPQPEQPPPPAHPPETAEDLSIPAPAPMEGVEAADETWIETGTDLPVTAPTQGERRRGGRRARRGPAEGSGESGDAVPRRPPGGDGEEAGEAGPRRPTGKGGRRAKGRRRRGGDG